MVYTNHVTTLTRAFQLFALMTVILSGCRSADAVTPHFKPLHIERTQFSVQRPAPFRALAERPVLDGAIAAQQEKLDTWLARLLSFGNHSEPTVDTVLSAMLNKWEEMYHAAEHEGAEYLHHWYFDVKGRVAFADSDYLAYKVRREEDEGWFHPFLNYRWSVWSFTRGRELYVTDIFNAESIPAIIDLIKADMARRHGHNSFAEYSQERCIDDFNALPQNFTLDERGIEFLFNAYEIACYADGDIRGSAGWESLAPYMREDFHPPIP